MSASLPDTPFDLDLLQSKSAGMLGRGRRATFWLLGLLLFLAVAMITLVLYLQTFEAEEDQRRRTADVQWLEQTTRFHFSRLEGDIQVLAHRVREREASTIVANDEGLNAGLLLRQPGVVLAHGWLPAGELEETPAILERLQADAQAHPTNAEMLAVMQDITRGLRRSSYAGPLMEPQAPAGRTIWLAVPLFERGVFSGNYLAALSLDRALDTLIPAWFRQGHEVVLMGEQQMAWAARTDVELYRAYLELPGTDLALQVRNTQSDSAMLPRIFFMVALLCLLGMLGSLYALRRDFVKRLRIQSQLQAQVALRSAMEKAVTVGLRAWDMQGRILYVNQAFCRMVGFEADELVGRQAPMPYWPSGQGDEWQTVHPGMEAQDARHTGVEVQFRHKGGQLLDVLVHEAPLHAGDGEQLGWMGSVVDISDRRKAERTAARQQEKLEASGRLVAMGEVASTLAHELNQPLGALSGFANGLLNRIKSKRLSDEELVSVVERMEQLSAKAGRIIQRVNAFARRREMSRERLDMVSFLRRVLAPLQRQRHGRLRAALPAEPLWVQADALLLEHAVVNLVNNADFWSHQGGREPLVEVKLRAVGESIELTVSDSGPGVGEDQRDQVFGAFFSGKEDGMGMGLAICRSVVEAHRGQIEVGRSDELGGACFTVRMPLVQQEPVDARPQPLDAEAADALGDFV